MRYLEAKAFGVGSAFIMLTLILVVAFGSASAQRRGPQRGSPAGVEERSTYQNPVAAGDFPDPSVIRVGRD